MSPTDLIIRKRDGLAHSPEEIRAIIGAIMDGSMADYQVSAWLMAVYLRGLNPSETTELALAIRDSGEVLSWEKTVGVRLDKHSTGGVGDKTTLIVVPLLAAAGVSMLKMSGRGLGFAGGTVDKLESIPGFRTELSIEQARSQVERIGAAIVGQTQTLAPADKKLYALRDVTGTVGSLPLIASSIMSKKLASGADAVLLDVKTGRGAYLKSMDESRELARTMVDIGRGAGVRTVAMLTDMDEPLGCAVGNSLEVAEACRLLTGTGSADGRFRKLCVALAVQGLLLADRAASETEAQEIAENLLTCGAAARKLEEIVQSQGGDPSVVYNPDRLPQASSIHHVRAMSSGYVAAIDAEAVGTAAMNMGAGRARKEDLIDPSVGIVLRKKVGDGVTVGEPIAELHYNKTLAPEWSERLLNAIEITRNPPMLRPVVIDIIRTSA